MKRVEEVLQATAADRGEDEEKEEVTSDNSCSRHSSSLRIKMNLCEQLSF